MRMARVVLLASACLLVLDVGQVQDVHAQGTKAYSSVSFAGGIQRDARSGPFHRYWTPIAEREAYVSTPFYLGHLELGFAPHRHEPVVESVPSFDAYFAYAAWDVGIRFPRQVRVAAGPRLGVYFMDFDVDTLSGARFESELALGGHVRLTIHPVSFVGVYAGASYLRTFTFVPIRLYQYSAGIVLTIRSPRWLVTVLR